MNKIAIAVHGGAGQDSPYIKENFNGYADGLRDAVEYGHELLSKGASAIDAIQEAVKILEDNELFNAGRGSALNRDGEVEMDAAIMDGRDLKAGAVSMIRGVKNPIELARAVMNYTQHVYIAGEGALKIAKIKNLEMRPPEYFVTQHQREELLEAELADPAKKYFGTVGAVALDMDGNLAAATSTGGITNSLHGRVGDSCIIGAGCYANNEILAASCTGDGELIMTSVIAHKVAMLIELKGMPIQEACDYVLKNIDKPFPGDAGIISVDKDGNFGIAYNSQRMHRAWITNDGKLSVSIYDPFIHF